MHALTIHMEMHAIAVATTTHGVEICVWISSASHVCMHACIDSYYEERTMSKREWKSWGGE